MREQHDRFPRAGHDLCDDIFHARADENARVVRAVAGKIAEHQRVPHWEIGAALGILDMERGAKIAGSMFPMNAWFGP